MLMYVYARVIYFEKREEIAGELTKQPRSKLTSEDIKNRFAVLVHLWHFGHIRGWIRTLGFI